MSMSVCISGFPFHMYVPWCLCLSISLCVFVGLSLTYNVGSLSGICVPMSVHLWAAMNLFPCIWGY